MTIKVKQEKDTGIWMMEAAGAFSQTNFQEEYSNIIQNYTGNTAINILVDLRIAELSMDYDTLIKLLIAFMDRNTPEAQPVNVAFVIKDHQSIITTNILKTGENLSVKVYRDRALAMAWLRS